VNINDARKKQKRYMAMNMNGEIKGPSADTVPELIEILSGAHLRCGLSGRIEDILKDYKIIVVEITGIQEVEI
jgi:hypothetical protein